MKNLIILLISLCVYTEGYGQTIKECIDRGTAKSKLEDYRGAILDYNKTIELNPKKSLAYYFRGVAKIFLGDKNGACLDWSKAGELGDGDAYDKIRKYCN